MVDAAMKLVVKALFYAMAFEMMGILPQMVASIAGKAHDAQQHGFIRLRSLNHQLLNAQDPSHQH